MRCNPATKLKAQDSFLHWALLLDENAQAAWLKEIPAELHNTIGSILRTANTISANPNDSRMPGNALGTLGQSPIDRTGRTTVSPGPPRRTQKRRCPLSSRSLIFGMGSIDEAEACFILATKLDPAHADSRYNLGLCHQTNGNSESAKQGI